MDILIRILDKDFLLSHISDFIEILSDEPHEYWKEDHFLADFPAKFELSIVALSGTMIAGYVISSLKKEGPYIHKFMVNKDYRGKSVGRKLLEYSKDNLIAKGYGNITLSVLEENQKAIKFYSNNGFIKTGSRISSDGCSLIIMRKNIS